MRLFVLSVLSLSLACTAEAAHGDAGDRFDTGPGFDTGPAFDAGPFDAGSDATPPTTPPDGAPESFLVDDITASEAVGSWTDTSSNEEEFVVERWNAATSSWVEHTTAPANSTSTVLAGLAPGTEYGMRVRARNALGSTDPSNEQWFTTLTGAPEECGNGTCAGGETCSSCPGDCGPCGDCAPGFRAMVSHDQASTALGDTFINWRRSVVDDAHSVSHGRAVRVTTDPGEELPVCSGSPFYAGRTRLPAPVPEGRTIWFRVYQYIPSDFSFGYKYASGDRDEARACSQPFDGNVNLKWLVFAPDDGTARIYLLPKTTRRGVRPSSPRIRVSSEAHGTGRAADFDGVDLPRDRWFSLQMAVRVGDEETGFIRAWLDDEFLGEHRVRTARDGTAMNEWGIGDYWNGVPWTDGAAGRTDFWIDEVIVASDAPGYDAPTGVDAGGRAYIPSCMRVSDLD